MAASKPADQISNNAVSTDDVDVSEKDMSKTQELQHDDPSRGSILEGTVGTAGLTHFERRANLINEYANIPSLSLICT